MVGKAFAGKGEFNGSTTSQQQICDTRIAAQKNPTMSLKIRGSEDARERITRGDGESRSLGKLENVTLWSDELGKLMAHI